MGLYDEFKRMGEKPPKKTKPCKSSACFKSALEDGEYCLDCEVQRSLPKLFEELEAILTAAT